MATNEDHRRQGGAALLALAALSVALWSWLAGRLRWRALALLGTLLVPAAVVILLHLGHRFYHPAAGFGWLGWGLVFAVHLWSLKRLAELLPAGGRSAAHGSITLVRGCRSYLKVSPANTARQTASAR